MCRRYLYSFGVFQDYYTRIFLSNSSPSRISWIGSLQLTMPYFLGAVSGKLFDAGYFHTVEILGSTLFTFSLFMLSLAKPEKYYQVFLSQGIGMGLGLGFLFVPTLSILVHHFKHRKALATGIALSGSSTGALVFPIMLNHLIPTIGFGSAVRASAYIVLGLLVIGNLLVRSTYDTIRTGNNDQVSIKGFFADPPYMCAVFGGFLASIGLYFPVIYLQLYAIQHNIDPVLAFYSLAIVNGVGAIGRVAGNYFADNYGGYNVFIPVTLATSATIFAIIGIQTSGALIVISVLYGLFSGAWLSLAMATLASLSRSPQEVGARTGIALALSSFGILGSSPIQGALLSSHFTWNKPIIFAGTLMGASAFTFIVTRTMLVKERGTQKV
ncbi:MFS general substrate transporter [Pholiota conissans]|uniref:MFS general substrate transporter n=1 Tax=Pholiota conissans TaxID=109636 RepID=A0A9P6CT30_9AGAR|nr:MFS general substrate transporter [Pholiota conissans]